MQILNLQGQFHHDAASPCGEALHTVKFQTNYFKNLFFKSLKSANPITSEYCDYYSENCL